MLPDPLDGSCGNALTWIAAADSAQQLLIVGKQNVKALDNQSNLWIWRFNTEGGRFTSHREYPKAEAAAVVRDRRGNFGIVGARYFEGSKKSDILFLYADSYGDSIRTRSFGNAKKKAFGRCETLLS